MKLDEQALHFRIRVLNNQIKRMIEQAVEQANINLNGNLTGIQYGILGFLSEKDEGAGIYQRDIEAEFNIRRSSASEMLITLEKKGFIQRITDKEDTRLKKIYLTQKAKDLDRVAKEHSRQIQDKLTKGISIEEMNQFYNTLQKIYENSQN